jgi:hypothetical protein
MKPTELVRPPLSHPYDYFQMRQAILLREAAQERLAQQVSSQQNYRTFYHGWGKWFGLRMISWGEHLAHIEHTSSTSKQELQYR